MSENISVCGTDCGACSFFGGLCRGCNECQGRVFHAPAGCACPIYACVREKKGLRNCAQCPDLPCSLWQSTRDPSFTDEQFAANIAGRVENLRKRMTNRELADFVSAQLAPLPEVRRIPMMGGFIFYYRSGFSAAYTARASWSRMSPRHGASCRVLPPSRPTMARSLCCTSRFSPIPQSSAPWCRQCGKSCRNVRRESGNADGFWEAQRQINKKVRQKGKKPPKTLEKCAFCA